MAMWNAGRGVASRRFSAWAGAAAVLSIPTAAHAFCRTTTTHEPVPYYPTTSGCWAEGTPLAWPAGAHVGYSLSAGASKQISLADATRVVDEAFATWNETTCDGHPVDIETFDNGPVSADAAANDCGIVMCDPTVHDPLHVIVFDDVMWPHNDPNSTLALTTVTYGVDSGTIYDADMEVNTAQQMITTQEPPPQGIYDLQSIITHEAGHFLGLAHATTQTPIMYAIYQPGAVTLTADDVAGICTIYPQPPPKAGCACESVLGSRGAGAELGAACVGLFVVAAVRRRRPRVTRR